MLAYYKTLEDYHLAQNMDLHAGGYRYGLTPGAFPCTSWRPCNNTSQRGAAG